MSFEEQMSKTERLILVINFSDPGIDVELTDKQCGTHRTIFSFFGFQKVKGLRIVYGLIDANYLIEDNQNIISCDLPKCSVAAIPVYNLVPEI